MLGQLTIFKIIYFFYLILHTCSSNDEISACPGQDNSEIDESGQDTSFKWSEKDEPVHLVKPDIEHKKLVLIEENLEFLKSIRGSVATVAVVGKFHSGKSFLMNQLMQKSNGFGVGSTVKPQTMGIWMWGKPSIITLQPSGETISVVFLDTEGFAANNISEAYDSKIFAVSTLLSSYLIYNTVGIIDQSEIDYLQVLTRITKLFALQTQSKLTEDLKRTLTSFPPLLWIVQGFSLPNDSPTDWLKGLMTSHIRENEDYKIKLLDIFSDVSCRTLFIPATEKSLLMDLSKASEEDLTPHYKIGRDEIIRHLYSNLKPKEKSGEAVTGEKLAVLLRVLVEAANDGSILEMPSRYVAFIQQLQMTTTKHCLEDYESELNEFLKQTPDYDEALGQYLNSTSNLKKPVVPQKLTIWHEKAKEKQVKRMEQTLIGLDEALLKSIDDLVVSIHKKFKNAFEENEHRIVGKCNDLKKILMSDTEAKHNSKYPMPTHVLNQTLVTLTKKSLQEFSNNMSTFMSSQTLFEHQVELKSSLKYVRDSVLLENHEKIKRRLESIIQEAENIMEAQLKNDEEIPRSKKDLENLIIESMTNALDYFYFKALLFCYETYYNNHELIAKDKFDKISRKARKTNRELEVSYGHKVVKEIVAYMEEQSSSRFLHLPMEDSELKSNISALIKQCQDKFDKKAKEYGFHDELKPSLKTKLEKIAAQRESENEKAYEKEAEEPLKNCNDEIKNYYCTFSTEFCLEQKIRKECSSQLSEKGKTKEWSDKLRIQIVNKHVEENKELRKLLQSKRSLWSIISGFVLRIIWFFGYDCQ